MEGDIDCGERPQVAKFKAAAPCCLQGSDTACNVERCQGVARCAMGRELDGEAEEDVGRAKEEEEADAVGIEQHF